MRIDSIPRVVSPLDGLVNLINLLLGKRKYPSSFFWSMLFYHSPEYWTQFRTVRLDQRRSCHRWSAYLCRRSRLQARRFSRSSASVRWEAGISILQLRFPCRWHLWVQCDYQDNRARRFHALENRVSVPMLPFTCIKADLPDRGSLLGIGPSPELPRKKMLLESSSRFISTASVAWKADPPSPLSTL